MNPATFEIWLTWFTHIAICWDHKGDKVLPGIGRLNDLRQVLHVWPRLGGRTCGLGCGRIVTGYGDQSIIWRNCARAGIWIFRVWATFSCQWDSILHKYVAPWLLHATAQKHDATPPYYIRLFDRGNKTRLLCRPHQNFEFGFDCPPVGRLVDWAVGRRSLRLDWAYGSNTSACSSEKSEPPFLIPNSIWFMMVA